MGACAPGSEVPLLEQVLRIKGLRPPPSAARAHHIKHLLSTHQGPSWYAHVDPILLFVRFLLNKTLYAAVYNVLFIVLLCIVLN